MITLAGVMLSQRGRMTTWTAIYRSPGRAWHIVLPLDFVDTDHDQAMAYATEHLAELTA